MEFYFFCGDAVKDHNPELNPSLGCLCLFPICVFAGGTAKHERGKKRKKRGIKKQQKRNEGEGKKAGPI